MTARCPQHPEPNPLCHVQQAGATFTGRVELRDGSDYGRVTGSWNDAPPARRWPLPEIVVAAIIATFVIYWLLVALTSGARP